VNNSVNIPCEWLQWAASDVRSTGEDYTSDPAHQVCRPAMLNTICSLKGENAILTY